MDKNQKLHEFAGRWKMSDEEVREMFKTLKKGWNKLQQVVK